MGKPISGQVVAFVHAKRHSERLPGKNLADLGGMPLMAWAIRAALAAETVNTVVIDSDDDNILKVGATYGAVPLKRPEEMGTNATTGDDLAVWQAKQTDGRFIVQVVPTCPFTKPETIDRVVGMLSWCDDVDTVVGVRREHLYLWQDGPAFATADTPLPNSSEIPPTMWETTGLYAMRCDSLLRTPHRVFGQRRMTCCVSAIEAIDINEPEDLEFARVVAAGLKARERNVYHAVADRQTAGPKASTCQQGGPCACRRTRASGPVGKRERTTP